MDVLLSIPLLVCMHISHHHCLDNQSMYRVYTVEWFVCLLFTSIIPLINIHHPIQISLLASVWVIAGQYPPPSWVTRTWMMLRRCDDRPRAGTNSSTSSCDVMWWCDAWPDLLVRSYLTARYGSLFTSLHHWTMMSVCLCCHHAALALRYLYCTLLHCTVAEAIHLWSVWIW